MNFSRSLTYKQDIDLLLESGTKAGVKCRSMDDHKLQTIIDNILDTFISSNDYFTRMLLDETHIGCYEDKIHKHLLAVEQIRSFDINFLGKKMTASHTECVINYDPIGLIFGASSREDPSLSILYMIYMAVRTRNPLFLSFHPSASQSSAEIARILRDAAVSSGLPEYAIQWSPGSLENRLKEVVNHPDVKILLATGSEKFCSKLKSFRKPCYVLTAQWIPAVISHSANPELAVTRIISSKSADHGMNYNSIQAIFAEESIYDPILSLLKKYKVHFLDKEETIKITSVLMDMSINAQNRKSIGLSAWQLAQAAKIRVPEECPALCLSPDGIGPEFPLSMTKLMPVLSVFKTKNLKHSMNLCQKGIQVFPGTRSCSFFSNDIQEIQDFSSKMTFSHILINESPSPINDEFLSYIKHLIHLKYICNKQEHTRIFKIPDKIYFNNGSLKELSHLKNIQRILIITDQNCDMLIEVLKRNQNYIQYDIFYIHEKLCTNDRIERGTEKILATHPDVIIAFGNQYTIDIAKGILLCSCFPEKNFDELSIKFMNIHQFSKKISLAPDKPFFIAIPTFIDSGTEATPFLSTVHQATGIHYPIMNYDLTPDMIIADSNIQKHLTCGNLSNQWIHLFVQAAEAYMSILSSDFTDALALQAMRLCYKKTHIQNASLLAGMAYGNALAGLTRAFSETISETFSIEMSICDAIIFPSILMYNGILIPSRLSESYPDDHYKIDEKLWIVCHYLDLIVYSDKKPDQSGSILSASILSKAFSDMRKAFSLPECFRDYGINAKEYESKKEVVCQKVFAHSCTSANPRCPSIRDLQMLYESFYVSSLK